MKIPPRDVRDERETVRLRASLVRMRTQVINKIRSIFHKYCIKYKGSLYQKSGMEFLNTLDLRPVDKYAIKSYLETLKTLNAQIESVNSQYLQCINPERPSILARLPKKGQND